MNAAIPTSTANGRGSPASSGTSSRPNSDSDRNNNATPPRGVATTIPPPLIAPHVQRRPSQPRSPPVGARPKDLPPGASPMGVSIPRPPPPSTSSQGISVPLLASQLGRPVNLGDRPHGSRHALPGNPLLGPGGLPPLSPHHLNLISHTLSPFAAIPTGNGKIMARNINGTCKYHFIFGPKNFRGPLDLRFPRTKKVTHPS